MKKVPVGDCAVIGAASIVISDSPKGAAVAGNPVHIVKMLGGRTTLEGHD